MTQGSAAPHGKHVRAGSEARTAVPVSPRPKAMLALAGFVLCAALAVVAWFADIYWLAIVLAVLAVLALVDIGWQLRKMRKARHRASSDTT